MKKKLLALALAVVMMMGLSTTAFAATDTKYTYTDELSVSVTKKITVTNGTAPSETLSFTVTAGDFEPYNTGDTATVPTIKGFTISTTNGEGEGTIELPAVTEFSALGTYSYTIKETAGTEAGMSYDKSVYTMKISIVLDGNGNKIRVVSIWNEDGEKVDLPGSGESEFGFTNTYTANSLSVTKSVKGNQGDTSKYFTFMITFADEDSAEKWTEAVGYTLQTYVVDADTTLQETKVTNTDGSVTYTVYLKDTATATFTNIPEGITYTVSESTEGYTQSVSGGSLSDETAGTDVKLVVTNTLDNEVPTGVNLDSLPYVMILGLVLIGAAYVISKRRLTDR